MGDAPATSPKDDEETMVGFFSVDILGIWTGDAFYYFDKSEKSSN
jgi:hypothetical protein